MPIETRPIDLENPFAASQAQFEVLARQLGAARPGPGRNPAWSPASGAPARSCEPKTPRVWLSRGLSPAGRARDGGICTRGRLKMYPGRIIQSP